MTSDITLVQFHQSHYNEKARWALDWKGIPHARTTLLPGPHMPTMKRLTGQTQTPALQIDGRCVPGSAAIIDLLEHRFPEPALYPEDAGDKKRALALQEWLDRDLGPQIRLALFSRIADEGSYICQMFARGRPVWQRALYRATYPIAKGMIKRGNGVTSQRAIDDAFAATRAAFDRIAAEVGPSGYLAGDRFSVADLTAASLAAAAANPRGTCMQRPEPMPQAMQDWLSMWADHPAIAWVQDMYARHRPSSAEIDAQAA